MKKRLVLLLTLCLLLAGQPVLAESQPARSGSTEPAINAEAAVLMDAATGQILYQRNPDEQLPIASITKMMTAIVALEKGNLDAKVTIGPDVMDRNKVYGTLVYLEPGEQFTLRELLYAMLLNSANDAAVAVADYIGGSVNGFVQMMNQEAQKLGAYDTHFMNPDGLTEPGHYSSARDMALIARYGLENPVFSQIVGTKSKDLPREKAGLPDKLDNINRMLWLYDGADGVKTGYTEAAEHTFVISATRDGRRLIAVGLKDPFPRTSDKDAAALLDYGFGQYHDVLLASKGQELESVKLSSGQALKLATDEDVYGTLANGTEDSFQLKPKPGNLALPIKAGEARGQLEVYLQGRQVQTVPLVAIESVDLPGSLPLAPKSDLIWYLLTALVLVMLVALQRHLARRNRRVVYRGGN